MNGGLLEIVEAGQVQRRSAQSTLLYALGDLVYPSRVAIPTAAFLDVLSQAGYETAAGRQALARARQAGWIVSERRSTEAWWSLTKHGLRLIEEGHRRIAALGEEPSKWDGRWVVLVLTVPHARRAVRSSLYRYLSWTGFGSPAPGLWLSPLVANEGGARFAIEHFELAGTTFSFVGTTGDIGLEIGDIVQQAWALDDLDSHYQRLVAAYRERTHPSDAEALQSVLQLDADLQGLPWLDPQLPRELAPTSTSREAARGLLQLRAQWVVAARRYWESLLPLSVGHL